MRMVNYRKRFSLEAQNNYRDFTIQVQQSVALAKSRLKRLSNREIKVSRARDVFGTESRLCKIIVAIE